MTPADSPLTAGPDLDARVAAACGLDYQVVNDVCYMCSDAATTDRYGEKWTSYHPSTNPAAARAAAAKIGFAGVSELPATATALEICAAILQPRPIG